MLNDLLAAAKLKRGHLTICDRPPNTYWRRDAKDRWVIQERFTGNKICKSGDLESALECAWEWAAANWPGNSAAEGRPTEPKAE